MLVLFLLFCSPPSNRTNSALVSNQIGAEFLRKELPIRLAHRIAEIRALPFIVGCNPQIQTVHDLYIHSFHQLNDLSPVTNAEDEKEFAEVLREFLDQHKDVISMLARGFKECRKHIKAGFLPAIGF